MGETHSAQGFHGVVLPAKPPIDKIAAMVLVETTMPEDVVAKIITFWDSMECPEEMLAKWRSEGIYPIDLGSEKYNRSGSGVGSATEDAARRLGLEDKPEIRKVVGMMNKNNKTGYLKGFGLSLAWLIRELYELWGYDHSQIVRRMAHVIHMFLVADKAAGWVEPLPDEGTQIAKDFPAIWERTQACSFAPFTIGRYLRDLVRSGQYTEGEIREWVGWWLRAWDSVEKAMLDARAEARVIPRTEFQARGLRGLAIETTSKFVVREVSRECQILVTRNPQTGLSVVLAKGFDLSALAAKMAQEGMEPGLWYYKPEAGQLLNGSVQYTDHQPTRFGLVELVGLVRGYPPMRKR